MSMWSKLALRVMALSLSVIVATMFSCSKEATVCTVSPIHIEELKSDIRDLDVELADTQKRLAEERAVLADRQATVDGLRAQVPGLELELERAKKASGKTFVVEDDVGQAAQAGQ